MAKMKLTVKCSGVLYEEMVKRVTLLSSLTMISYLLTFCILFMVSMDNSMMGKISGFMIFWFFIGLFVMKQNEYGRPFQDWVTRIVCFPIYSTTIFWSFIFRSILIRKYPEIDREHYERWRKLKMLQKKINRKQFKLF